MIKFVELENFGVNLLTVTFVVTLFFTALQSFALFKQNQKIVKNSSGKSVSFIFFSYYGFAAMAVIIYGLFERSLALFINGFMGFIALAIVINILRFEKISKRKKIFGLGSVVVIPLIIILPQKDSLFLIVGMIINLTLFLQILEIWKNKSSGSVHPGPALVSTFSNFFWLSYSVVADIWPMQIINSFGLALWIFMLITYYQHQPKKILS